MLFTSYSSTDADSVLRMLSNHVDYAPEAVFANGNIADTEFFREIYVEEPCGGYAYVLKANDGYVKSFAAMTKWQDTSEVNCWYVTSLFVENGENADELALQMITEIRKSLSMKSHLCINVHPKAEYANNFWRINGYHIALEKCRYVNCDGERLSAYSK